MKRRLEKLRSVLVVSILMALTCNGIAGDLWPQNQYAHVVGYCYDYSQGDRGFGIVLGGFHHRGIISAMTVRLSKDQKLDLSRLLLVSPKTPQEEFDCFSPHHAFVFYDEDWNVKAHASLCFSCGNFKAHPANIPKDLNIEALKKFVVSIGLPVFEDDASYSKLYRRLERKDEEQAASAVGVEPKVNAKAGSE